MTCSSDRTQCDERENVGNGDDIHHHSVLSGLKSTGMRPMCGESAMDGQDWRNMEKCIVLITTTHEVARSI